MTVNSHEEGLLEKAFFNFQIFNLAGVYLLTDKGLRYAIYYALAWFRECLFNWQLEPFRTTY